MTAGRTNLNQTAHPSLSPFPLTPVSSRCPHRTSSSVTSGGGCGRRVSGQAGGDEGWLSFRPIRRAVLPLESAARTRAEASACIHARVCVSIRALTSAAVCDFVFMSSGVLLSCCSFFFFPSSSSSSSCLSWHLVLCAGGPLCSDHGWELLRVSCTASISEFPLHLGNSAQMLFYFQQCFKFRRKDIHALLLIAHLCLPCYFCHFNFFFFGFQSSSFGMKC